MKKFKFCLTLISDLSFITLLSVFFKNILSAYNWYLKSPFQKVGVQKTAVWSDGALVCNILQIAIKIADYLLDPKLGAGVVWTLQSSENSKLLRNIKLQWIHIFLVFALWNQLKFIYCIWDSVLYMKLLTACGQLGDVLCARGNRQKIYSLTNTIRM